MTPQSPSSASTVAHASGARPPIWKSKLVLLSLLLTTIGAGLWVRAAMNAPPVPAAGGSSMVGSLTDGGRSATGVTTGTSGGSSVPPAPLPFRLGVSFMAGFFVAWLLKKFLKMTLLLGGAIALVIAALKGSGVITLDWASVEHTVEHGMTEAQEHATAAKDWIVAYLPSGASTAIGMFVGIRRA